MCRRRKDSQSRRVATARRCRQVITWLSDPQQLTSRLEPFWWPQGLCKSKSVLGKSRWAGPGRHKLQLCFACVCKTEPSSGSRACTSKFINISFGAHAGELQCGDRCKMPGRRHRYSNVLDWCHGTAANRSRHPFFFTIGVRAVPHWRFASHAFPIHKNAQGGNCTIRFGGQQTFAAESRPKSGLMLFRMGKKQVGTEKKGMSWINPPHPLTVSHHQDQYILSRESLKAFILQCYQVGGRCKEWVYHLTIFDPHGTVGIVTIRQSSFLRPSRWCLKPGAWSSQRGARQDVQRDAQ